MTDNKLEALLSQFGGNAFKMWQETGILLPIAGGAKGINSTDDILTVTVDGTPLSELYDEISASLDILNAQRSALMQVLTFPVTDPFEEIMPIIGDEFEEADEFGQPKGIRLGTPWNMGYDLKYFDLGIRYTFRFLGRATSGQIRALNNSALEADQRLQMKTIMTRIFDNTNTSATIESSGRAVTSYPFFNGATTTLPAVPPPWKTYTHTNTHNHYLTSGNANLTSANLDTMYDHIHHHGYDQSATIWLLVNRVEAKRIRAFRVTASDQFDFIPVTGSPLGDTPFRGTLVGELPGGAPGGAPAVFPGVVGVYGNMWIVEEDYIPAGYVVMFASGGKFADKNPVGLREHENESLRGLKLIPQFDRYPLREAFYHHAIGTGVRHPAAGVVMQVTAGAWAIPALSFQGQGGR